MSAVSRRALPVALAGSALVLAAGLLLFKLRSDAAARGAKLTVCHDWEKVAGDRLAAGQFSAARGALVSVRTTCAYDELDDGAAATEENSKLIALEHGVTELESAAEKQQAAATTPVAPQGPASATVPMPLAPAERARALAGLDELRRVIRRQEVAQGHESEEMCRVRLDAESPRIKAAEAKVGLASMGVHIEDNSDVEGAPQVVREKLGLDTVHGASAGKPTTRFSSSAPYLGWTPDEFVWACQGCRDAEDIADMRGDRGCAHASMVLDDLAEAVKAAK